MWTKDRKILKVQPSEGPVNAISTCVKGKFGWDFINSEERITKPLIRKNDAFVESSWDEALDLIATKLGGIQKNTVLVLSALFLLLKLQTKKTI